MKSGNGKFPIRPVPTMRSVIRDAIRKVVEKCLTIG